MPQNGDQISRRDFHAGALGMAGFAVAPVMGIRDASAAVPGRSGPEEATEPLGRYGWEWQRRVVASARGHQGMIASTRGGAPMEAGLATLRAGANAADAALSMALAQVVHSAGAWVTCAGIFTLVYFDARTRQVYSLDAGFDTVRDERDPMTIPKLTFGAEAVAKDIGRTVLVPGFMAGVEAAHRRFGSIPFERLFDAAIDIAERGMVIDAALARNLARTLFTRLPESRAFARKADGSLYQAGDVFRQPALASTLRAVARKGADYMYRGAWARKFVAGVRADGGRMSMDDLAAYEPRWAEPLHTRYKGYDIHSLHHCHFMHGGLRLAQEARLADMGRYYENPDVFYYYHKIFRATGTNMSIMGARVDNLPVPPGDWLDDAKVAAYWPLIRDGRFPPAPGMAHDHHTDAIVAADAQGNVAALMHSSNGALTGLFVDGVSVVGPASQQQNHVRKVGPGAPLPNMVPNTIALKNGKPVFATAAAGTALHQETIKIITNLIDYGKAGREAVQAASFVEPYYSDAGIEPDEVVREGDYAPELLDAVRARGMAVTEVNYDASPHTILSSNASASPETGQRAVAGGTPSYRNGLNLGRVALVVIDPGNGEFEGVSPRIAGDARGF